METSQEENTFETVENLDQLDEFYDGSYYTITGAGGDLNEWTKGYTELLEKDQIGKPEKFYTFKGKQMNDKYELTGNAAYDPTLTFLSFPLEGLNTAKLAIFKLKMNDRWFDDIVDNNEVHKRRS